MSSDKVIGLVKGCHVGLQIENALKVYLTLLGADIYRDDPEVKQVLDSLWRKSLAHTPPVDMKRSRDSSVDLFAQAFIQEYKDRKEVTKGELSYFASFSQGVVDPRSVQNRINYLVASGVLDPVAPNIFNVQILKYIGGVLYYHISIS